MRRGVPAELRSQVWSRCLEDGVQRLAGDGDSGGEGGLGSEAEDVPPWVSQLIENDVPRTFANWTEFQEAGGQEKLRRSLRRFALDNPSIGYCQSLNFIAAVLLMIVHCQEAVPPMMGRLLGKLDARQWYTEGMEQLRADALVLSDLVRKRMPVIHGALHTHSFNPLFVCPRWFLSLFSTALEGEALLRVWDVIMADGVEAVFRVALALLAWREDELVRARSQDDVLELLLMRRCEVDVDELLAIAYHPELLGPHTGADLEERRRAALGRIASSDGERPGGAIDAARALAPYLLAHYARDLMAAGREARGREVTSDYRLGDLSRGLLAKSRRLAADGLESGGQRLGSLARGLASRISAHAAGSPLAASPPAEIIASGEEAMDT